MEAHSDLVPGQIGEYALVAAMDPLGGLAAYWAAGRWLPAAKRDGQCSGGTGDVLQAKAPGIGKQGECVHACSYVCACPLSPKARKSPRRVDKLTTYGTVVV